MTKVLKSYSLYASGVWSVVPELFPFLNRNLDGFILLRINTPSCCSHLTNLVFSKNHMDSFYHLAPFPCVNMWSGLKIQSGFLWLHGQLAPLSISKRDYPYDSSGSFFLTTHKKIVLNSPNLLLCSFQHYLIPGAPTRFRNFLPPSLCSPIQNSHSLTNLQMSENS